MALTPQSSDTFLLPWLNLADNGAVIVTSNQRAARYLLRQHTALARSRSLAGWATPRILTWDAWLASLWQEITLADPAAPVLLKPEQELELWRATVAASNAATPWNEVSLATLAQQAWQLLHQYSEGLPELARSSLHRPDWQQFQKWATKFSVDNRRNGWLPRAQLANEIERRLAEGNWAPPAQLILWGFDVFTPAQQKLLAAIRTGSEVHLVQPSVATTGSGQTFTFSSQQEEFRAAASWARQRLQTDPQATLAIITTKAQEDRGLAYRAFTQELAPDEFNFSLGFPLSHFPLVQAATTLLRWTWQPLPPQQISSLLQSFPFNSSEESLLQLAQFDCDVFLKRNGANPSSTLEEFTRWLDSSTRTLSSFAVNDLSQRCKAALRERPRRDTASTADTWADLFRKILSAFQFPGPLANSSADFQTHGRWQQLLDDFASLSFNGATFTARDALARLQQMADAIIFQPASLLTNVEILGPLEASGSLFDGIFFASCTEERWPLPAAPNPLLPLDLQQRQNMPGSVRGANVAAAKELTERLLRSAPEVFFSSPTRGPEGEIRPSAVLHIPPAPGVLQQKFWSPYIHSEPQLVPSDEPPPPPWNFARGTLNVAALKSQAACPFQAFANHRLGTSDLRLPEDGHDPLQRGNLVHDLLHHVWLGKDSLPGLISSAKLHELADARSLHTFVEQHAEALLTLRESSTWEREFLISERARISTLVCRWLTEVEMRRAPFEVTEGEQRHEIAIKDLVQLRVRLDRVDKLIAAETSDPRADQFILIDYKTGKVDLCKWQPPRLDEPQLPLYAEYAVSQPVAIAFGCVRADDAMGLEGLAVRSGILPGVEPGARPFANLTFSDVLDSWRNDILNLAQEFAAGEARVDPKHGSKTCEYCGLQSLCRVAETGVLLRDEAAESPSRNGETNA